MNRAFFKNIFSLIFLGCSISLSGSPTSDSLSIFSNAPYFTPWRFWTATSVHAAAIPTSLKGLNSIKYANSNVTDFYWRNDNADWMQVDKVGQFWATYRLSQISSTFYNWTGLSKDKSAKLGTLLGFATISSFELFDGRRTNWGASFGDIALNSLGASLVFFQWTWDDPYALNIKYSSSSSIYAKYNPNLLGSNRIERLFNDYNSQTFWASVRLNKLVPVKKIPNWLNVAFGYGADGMIGERINPSISSAGDHIPQFDRYRQYYLSLDIDIRRFQSKIPIVSAIFKNFGFIKIPAPTLEFSKYGVKFYPIFL